ncbi:CRISPR-associated protein Cas5 [Spirosoma montaniterrae]|uniref:CRISPR-associated protein Cas5 n=1 Tax=Spirosoma montaniterrae TaxID=1178516 RepID=A0A1P9WYK2_9BACT|nr:CRISPR-associated protein Cas5 [Spirosoma montaniterrae]AQG80465.1 CRISPR-associated protein Cas5 [Spirosoma montaniterrae]
MLCCTIELKSVTASFRNPEFQNFHKSFPLPPPTALIGLAGAALGYSPRQAQDFFDTNGFRAGVSGKGEGMTRDLWKYDRLTGTGSSIILRELYVNTHYRLVFGSENHAAVEQLRQAFDRPFYALTLGQSDSLAKVMQTTLTDAVTDGRTLENTLVEGDIVPAILEQVLYGGTFALSLSTSDPIAYQLPTRFQYKSDYGMRTVAKRKLFSFVGPKVTFQNQTFPGVQVGDVFVPLFAL